METTSKTARELYEALQARPARQRFGFGDKAALVNIDLQKAYTRTDRFATAYEADPRQLEHINRLAARFRCLGWPVVWTHVAYMDSGEDAGIWGTRSDTPDALQNIKFGSERSEFDERLEIDRDRDVIYLKKMPSAFFETPLQSLLGRYAYPHRRIDLGLRARHGGREPVAGLPDHRGRAVCRGQTRKLSLRQSDRSGAEVR